MHELHQLNGYEWCVLSATTYTLTEALWQRYVSNRLISWLFSSVDQLLCAP